MAGLNDDDGLVEDDGSFGVEPDADLRGEAPLEDDGSVIVEPTREEKKRRRYDDLAGELTTLKSELERIKAQPPPQNYQQFAPPQQQPQEDPEVAALNARMNQNAQRRREMERLFEAEQARGNMNPQRQEELQKQYRDLDVEHQEMVVERVALKRRPNPYQQQQAALWMQLNVRYPDIMQDTRAYQHASSLMGIEATENPGKVFTWEDYDRIAETTRVKLGKKAPPVSDTTKARYAGHSAGGNGATGGGEEFPMRLDKDEARMALSTYRDLVAEKGEKAAYTRFWHEVKLPQLKEQAAARKKTG